jgi:hypothetical protein
MEALQTTTAKVTNITPTSAIDDRAVVCRALNLNVGRHCDAKRQQ